MKKQNPTNKSIIFESKSLNPITTIDLDVNLVVDEVGCNWTAARRESAEYSNTSCNYKSGSYC